MGGKIQFFLIKSFPIKLYLYHWHAIFSSFFLTHFFASFSFMHNLLKRNFNHFYQKIHEWRTLNIDFTKSSFFIWSFPFSILQIDKVKSDCRFSPVYGRITKIFNRTFFNFLKTFIDFSQIWNIATDANTGLICRKDSFWLTVMKFLSSANFPKLFLSECWWYLEGKHAAGSNSMLGTETERETGKSTWKLRSGIWLNFD